MAPNKATSVRIAVFLSFSLPAACAQKSFCRRDAPPRPLASEIRITPHDFHGEIDGYTVSDVKSGSGYDLMGFKDGDIILRVNNRPATNARALQPLERIYHCPERIQVDILRDHQRKRLQKKPAAK